MTVKASVVIAAHDEESVIVETLRTVLSGIEPGALEVVVVCNGCTDRTADAARTVPGVGVLEIETASKIEALNAGDDGAVAFPRIYLDADVRLSGPAVLALAEALDDDGPLAAGVQPRLDLSGSTLPVRWYYGFRQRLPVFEHGIIGAGVYAMNAAGRARFQRWPKVLGDDQFVLRSFPPSQRRLVSGHHSVVAAPRDLKTVVRRGVRVRRGNAQLSAGAAGEALTAPPAGVMAAVRSVLTVPSAWPGLLTWVTVTAWSRLRTALGGRGDWSTSSQ